MKLAQLLEQLNQLAKERPEALEMEVFYSDYYGDINLVKIEITPDCENLPCNHHKDYIILS